MHSQNKEDELIFTLKEKDFDTFREFLKSLKFEDENSDILEHWFYESFWTINTEEDMHFNVAFGVKNIHVILKKIGEFEKLREKFLEYFSF